MKKATRITYDPFANSIEFKIAQSADGPWTDLSDGSALLKYVSQRVLFSNCVVDIVNIINDNQNSVSDGLDIQFVGPDSDFELLCATAKKVFDERGGAGSLTCSHQGCFSSADETLDTIRRDYKRISSEFDDYLPGSDYYENENKRIGDTIVKFEETISDAIPVCVIGNYSVGKSALINSLIGEDILPSKVNPSTAKNVKVVRSEDYRMTLFRNRAAHEFEVTESGLKATAGNAESTNIAEALNKIACPEHMNEVSVIRCVLDALNEGARHPEHGDYLATFECNVVIELPFKKSLLDSADNKIVFYDTPGSDNNDVDQAEHSQALEDLLGDQTNALPILVTERDRTSGRGTGEVMHMLDEYAENFASPGCLVVLTKCDKLSKSELRESVSSDIRNWHGKSIILFTTPIGALGARRDEGKPWLDESYKDSFEDWQIKQNGPKRISLPEYNSYPCGRRGNKEELNVGDDLFDTGIPSLEYEILYYIENYSKYKKCVRGRKDLLDSLAVVKSELSDKRSAEETAKKESIRRKAEKRAKLISELDSIQIAMPIGLDEELSSRFQGSLDSYCDGLEGAMGEIYDRLNTDHPLEMDEELNSQIWQHCQENLVDAVYLASDGAKAAIVATMTSYAEDFASKLQNYVSKNESHFSDYGRQQLSEYLQEDMRPPAFSEVNSILENIGELFEKASLIRHGVLRLTRNEEAARSSWIESKADSFESKLRGRKDLLGRNVPGLFLSTVFTRPIEAYFAQLLTWSRSYRKYIKDQLDKDNTLLSDMEAEIECLESRIVDLERRLSDVTDVEDELDCILNAKEMG